MASSYLKVSLTFTSKCFMNISMFAKTIRIASDLYATIDKQNKMFKHLNFKCVMLLFCKCAIHVRVNIYSEKTVRNRLQNLSNIK